MSSRANLPEVLRIKRKRNQDSLQALILEAPRNKRIKDEQYVFKLQRTDSGIVQLKEDGNAVLPLLQEASGKELKQNTFILPKEEAQEEKLPDEFTEMLDSVLSLPKDETESTNLKKRKHRTSTQTRIQIQKEKVDLEYVYDVYYRDRAVHETWEKEKIGYIKFEEDVNDLDEDDESIKHLSDDEDSNAEDFYKNDYPEDEDDFSQDDAKSESSLEVLTESMVQSQQHSLNHDSAVDELREEFGDDFDDLYDELYDDEGNGPSNFLDNGADADDEYERQNFFPGEEDDELAQHRDRIFGKLQKMIDEDN